MCVKHNIVMPGSKPFKSTSTIKSKLQQAKSPKTETGADSLNHSTALSDIKTSLDALKSSSKHGCYKYSVWASKS